MKVKLIGINEEPSYTDLPTVEPRVQSPSGTVIMARLNIAEKLPSPQGYNILVIPYEFIRGAQIGDEFTLHLERIKK